MEEWVIRDFREVQRTLVARRQRIVANRPAGPWQGPFHARGIACNHWISFRGLGPDSLAFTPLEVDLKRRRTPQGETGLSRQAQPSGASASESPHRTKGTLRQQEIALSRQGTAEPRTVVRSRYNDRANRQCDNLEKSMSTLIFTTPD